MATPQLLKSLQPERIATAIAADPRLIVPVGTCDAHGPHLPIGCDTILVDRLADDLAAEFGVLRASTIEYGATDAASRGSPAPGCVRKKTLHLFLNDLLVSWEESGVREFILLTANGDDAHQEALATVMTVEARVRVVDASPARLGAPADLPVPWRPGGEAETSLMLYLAPHLVDLTLAQDNTPQTPGRRPIRWGPRRNSGKSALSFDGVGDPSPAKGEVLYRHVRERIAERIFRSPTAVG
jgi:creatinine amidohydrolase/Fe(II)-dependent formamide hydrolase-like protein